MASLIVGVLGGVLRLAGVIAAPVHAAVCLVVAVFQEELVGVAGIFGKVCPAGQHGRLGEEPQNAAVQDAALFGFFIQLQVKIHVAVKAAVSSSRSLFQKGMMVCSSISSAACLMEDIIQNFLSVQSKTLSVNGLRRASAGRGRKTSFCRDGDAKLDREGCA